MIQKSLNVFGSQISHGLINFMQNSLNIDRNIQTLSFCVESIVVNKISGEEFELV